MTTAAAHIQITNVHSTGSYHRACQFGNFDGTGNSDQKPVKSSLLLHQAEFLPARLLRRGNPLAAGGGYLAGAAASNASQSLEGLDGVVQSLHGGFGFPELSSEDAYYVEFWHARQCNASASGGNTRATRQFAAE
ncbi:MAG: hypothetical protein WAQ52_12880 [Terriglobales bacterium]